MAISINAVAAICDTAPANAQRKNEAVTGGSGSFVQSVTIKRNKAPKGRPNKKRTRVAPTVPMVCVSPRCMALRAVCPVEAITVKITQSQPAVSMIRFSGNSLRAFGGEHVVHVHVGGRGPVVM